jgi:predicted nucleotidyltransferase
VNLTDPNLPLLESVAHALGLLCDRFVFVGGCAAGLLVTDPAASPVRATRDVDVVVEVVSLAGYHALERQLEQAGFKHDRSLDAPVYRWIVGGCMLDVMPTDARVLGFGNRWYDEAVRTAVSARLPSGRSIRLIAPPVFLATKLEAFYGRGGGDFLASHDLEDLAVVIDGRPELVDEVAACEAALRAYLADEIGSLLRNAAFLEALSGHLPGDETSQARLPIIRERPGCSPNAAR